MKDLLLYQFKTIFSVFVIGDATGITIIIGFQDSGGVATIGFDGICRVVTKGK